MNETGYVLSGVARAARRVRKKTGLMLLLLLSWALLNINFFDSC